MFRTSLLLLTSAFSCVEVRAQPEAPVTLNIEVANIVIYRSDVADSTRFATEPGPTTPLPLRTFMPVTFIGDVVAVNGTPAKGNMTMRGTFLALDRNPAPSVGVADTINRLFGEWAFNIQRTDGSPVGSIMATGWAFGDRAAGVLAPGQGDLAVSGGTGAFLGVRGQGNETGTPAARRAASITEDPANRRIIGGNAWSYGFQLIPMARPAFATSANRPMLFHADFTPVTAANPARKGEVLIAAVTGLGPTLPGKQPGAPFPADTLQEVASPIQVLVNGAAVNSANQVGWPGTAGTYRVDFRVPEDTATGMAAIQLVSAWIPGPSIQIPVR